MSIESIRNLKARYFSKDSFIYSVLTLLSGTVLAQSIPVILSPIITRIYAPKEYGIFALYTAIVSIPTIVATGRYELAIMLPEKDEDAISLAALSLIITIFLSIISLFVVLSVNDVLANAMGVDEIEKYLYFVPISVLVSGLYQAFNYWTSRNKEFNKLSLSRLYQTIVGVTLSIVMGLLGFGVSGLIIGGIVGQSVAAGFLGGGLLTAYNNNRKFISRNRIIENAKRFQDFPKVNSLHAFSDVIQTNGLIFLISFFFGSSVLGLYSLTLKVLKAPLNLIGSSISQVFYQKASHMYTSKINLYILTKKIVVLLSIIAFPLFLLFMVFAPSLFSTVFGKQWTEAGVYARILSPWLFFGFIMSPISVIPLIVNKQKLFFLISFIYNLLLLLPMTSAGLLNYNVRIAFTLMSALLSGYLLFMISWVISITKNTAHNTSNKK